MKNKCRLSLKILGLFVFIFGFASFSCNHSTDTKNKKDDKPGKTGETESLVEVTKIQVGDYSLNANEVKKAESKEGFEKEFPNTQTGKIKIAIDTEKDAKITFTPENAKDGIELTTSKIKILAKVEKTGRKMREFVFLLYKKENSPSPNPPTTEVASLASLNIGTYEATEEDIKKAATTEGFSYTFNEKTTEVIVVAVAKGKGVITFKDGKDRLTLKKEVQKLFLTVKEEGKTSSNYTLNLNKKEAQIGTLQGFEAGEFEGHGSQDVDYPVINSHISWQAYEGATHYNVFINDKQTNDPADGEITALEFHTQTGTIDLDKEMGDEEKDVKITVKALDATQKVLAIAETTKKLPKLAKVESVLFNDVEYSKNMEIENPVAAKIKLNNKIKFHNEKEKLDLYLLSNLRFEANMERIPSVYSFDEGTGTITISIVGGLKENRSAKFIIAKGFSDAFKMNYAKEDMVYELKIKKSAETAPAPKVLKMLINDQAEFDIMQGEKSGVDVNSSISIYFNQLIFLPSYTVATAGDDGTKGNGIYITTEEGKGKKGLDPSRLTDAKWENVMNEGKLITKVTFKMVGKLYFTSSDPLEGNTKYYVVVDGDLKTPSGKQFDEVRYSFSTGAKQEKLYTFTVQGGTIEGHNEKEIKLKQGDSVTIRADIPEGKKFEKWNIGPYSSLTPEQQASNPLTYTMIGEDVTIWATFKD